MPKQHNERLHADAQTYALFVGFAALHFTTKTSPAWALVSRALERKMKLLPSSRLLLWLTAFSLIVGSSLGPHYQNFDWLARFGALVICWGILLLVRPSFVGKVIGQHVIAHDSGLSLFVPEYFKRKGEPIPDWVTDNVLSRRVTEIYGSVVCFIGILAAGFASLLNGVAVFAP